MKGLGYWTLSTEFLALVEAVTLELLKSENPHVVIGDLSDWERYDEITKWSDFRIGVPILFNFFHGVELMLKGFLATGGQVPPHHRLTQILTAFQEAYPDSKLASVVSEYVPEPDPTTPLGQFFEANGIGVDAWYEALKYPESRAGIEFTHAKLKYGQVNALAFWDGIHRAAVAVRTAGVELAGELDGESAEV